MDRFLTILQRVLEPAPMRGKGRLADFLLKDTNSAVTCHPLPGVSIHLNTAERIERLMWAGAYERDLVQTLKSHLKPGMVFVDVGANIGYFSSIAAALVGQAGHVYAFEPSPACFTRLRQNLTAFEQATCYRSAVSDSNDPVNMYLHPTESGWASLYSDRDLPQEIQVQSTRLDDWAQRAGLHRIDMLKLDIEGGEYVALAGAYSVIRRFRPIIIAELNGVCLARSRRSPEDVLRLLAEAGYVCRRTSEGVFATPAA
jgi:FkbM family methyltransferase